MIDDTNKSADFVSDESPHFSAEQSPQEFAAWEEIDKGRFMPRRVRGSNPGRALGCTFLVPSSGSDESATNPRCAND